MLTKKERARIKELREEISSLSDYMKNGYTDPETGQHDFIDCQEGYNDAKEYLEDLRYELRFLTNTMKEEEVRDVSLTTAWDWANPYDPRNN